MLAKLFIFIALASVANAGMVLPLATGLVRSTTGPVKETIRTTTDSVKKTARIVTEPVKKMGGRPTIRTLSKWTMPRTIAAVTRSVASSVKKTVSKEESVRVRAVHKDGKMKLNPVGRFMDGGLDVNGAIVSTMHMEYTTHYPAHCSCVLGKGLHNGICYEYTYGKQCKARPCKSSFVCIDGSAPKNALTCYRKKNTKKIVSNGDGTCRTKHIPTYGYQPYA